jgi:nitroreductase
MPLVNVYLQAYALGCGMLVIGAFDEESVEKDMHLLSIEEPIYLMSIGKSTK